MVERNPARPSGRRISAEKDARLVVMAAKGMSAPDMAEALDVHKDTVRAWIRRLGLTVRTIPSNAWPADDVTQLAQLWMQGATSGQIAIKLGYSRNAVIGKVGRLKLKRPEAMNVTNRAEAGRDLARTYRALGQKPEARAKAVETRRANGWNKGPIMRKPPTCVAVVDRPVVLAARGVCKNPDGCERPIARGSFCGSCASRFYVATPKMDVAKVSRWFR